MNKRYNFILRKAEEMDLQRMNEIYNWAVLNSVATFDLVERGEADAKRWFDSHQDPYYPLYVVEANGEIAGWGSLSPFHTRAAYKQSGEFSIYIALEWRGMGIGSLILKKLYVEAKNLGYHTLLGLITATNQPSLLLARKFGFLEVGRFREVGKKFGQNLDVIVMQKML